MHEKIIEAIASRLNKDATELSATLKDGEKWLSDDEFSEKISAILSDEVKAAKADQHKRAQRETWGMVEKELKKNGFDNPDKLQGAALIQAYAEAKQQSDVPEGKAIPELSREELIKLPVVRDLLQERERKASEKWVAREKELLSEVQSYAQTEKNILLEKFVRGVAAKAKAKLGDDPETETLRINSVQVHLPAKSRVEKGVLRFFNEDDYEITDEAEASAIKALNALGFVQKQDPSRGGSGAQGSRGTGGNGEGKDRTVFDSPQAFDKAFLAETDPAKRATMQGNWIQQQKEAAG